MLRYETADRSNRSRAPGRGRLAGAAPAQDSRLADARREGKVVWHTTLALDAAERLAGRFEQTYSGVNVEVHRSGSERVLQRIMQELQAGIKNAPARGIYAGRRRQARAGVPRPRGLRLVSAAEAPRAKNKPMLVQSIHDPARTVASGERAAGVNGADYGFLYTERHKGSPIAASYPRDGIVLIFSPTAITSFAPHPAAARLFTDFVFTREIQQLLADAEGLYVAHAEVTYPADRPKLSEIKVLTVDPEEIERRTEEAKKRFVELFGA
jgi:hypothetical protein